MGKKLLSYAALAFLMFFVLSNPAGAARTAKNVAAALTNAGGAFGAFFTALAG